MSSSESLLLVYCGNATLVNSAVSDHHAAGEHVVQLNDAYCPLLSWSGRNRLVVAAPGQSPQYVAKTLSGWAVNLPAVEWLSGTVIVATHTLQGLKHSVLEVLTESGRLIYLWEAIRHNWEPGQQNRDDFIDLLRCYLNPEHRQGHPPVG